MVVFLFGRVDQWMAGWLDEWTPYVFWLDKRMVQWMYKQMERWLVGWLVG